MTKIAKITWRTFSALSLESDLVRVVIVPELGAKIVSLFDKARQHEWLAPPMRPLKQTIYGADFVSQDMSGWDEMLPTIVACDYQGGSLPDHGEVWSIPWQVEQTTGAVSLSVAGVALRYRFTRSAALVAADCLELHYSLANTGSQPFHYLYAAHPQFNADEKTRLVLPPEVTQLINVIQDDPAWGDSGTLHNWPMAVDRRGQTWQLDRVRPPTTIPAASSTFHPSSRSVGRGWCMRAKAVSYVWSGRRLSCLTWACGWMRAAITAFRSRPANRPTPIMTAWYGRLRMVAFLRWRLAKCITGRSGYTWAWQPKPTLIINFLTTIKFNYIFKHS